MYKNVKVFLAAALLLSVCVSLMACRQKPTTPATNQPSTTGTQPAQTEQTGETTEATEETHGIITQDPNAPSLDVETEIGDDRGDITGGGSGNEQTPTKPTEPEPTTPSTKPDTTLSMNYQQYMSLTSAQQQELFDKHFSDNPLAFAEWFQKIKAEYEDEIPEIIATGPVDIGDYINP